MNEPSNLSAHQKPTNELPPKAKNHFGKRFGFLTAKEYAGKDKNGKARWTCICDCGTEVVAPANGLVTKYITSCGVCSKKTNGLKRRKQHRNTPLYRKYWSMIDRCQNKSSKVWDRYGGRGITVCDRWRKSFDDFVEDMGVPGPKMTIERIDNNKGYSPENCRWATMQEQQRNRRDTVFLTFNSQTKCLADWAKELNVTPQALSYRVRNGYSTEDIFTKPFRR
jgi:hypothetical protein